MSEQPQAPALVEIGGEIILKGYRFTVVAHSTDNAGHPVEVPGDCLGRASKEQIAKPKQAGRARVASAHNPTMAPAPTVVPAPPTTPTAAPAAPTASTAPTPATPPARTTQQAKPQQAMQQAKPRAIRRHYSRRHYPQFPQKPPPLKIVNEPWPLCNWIALIVVLALVVAGIWLSNAGSERTKWDSIEAAARAVRGR